MCCSSEHGGMQGEYVWGEKEATMKQLSIDNVSRHSCSSPPQANSSSPSPAHITPPLQAHSSSPCIELLAQPRDQPSPRPRLQPPQPLPPLRRRQPRACSAPSPPRDTHDSSSCSGGRGFPRCLFYLAERGRGALPSARTVSDAPEPASGTRPPSKSRCPPCQGCLAAPRRKRRRLL